MELRPRAARAEAEAERVAGQLAVVQQAAGDAAEAARGAAEAAAEELRVCRGEVGSAEEKLEARGSMSSHSKCGHSKCSHSKCGHSEYSHSKYSHSKYRRGSRHDTT